MFIRHYLESPNEPNFTFAFNDSCTIEFEGWSLDSVCSSNWAGWQWEWNFGDPNSPNNTDSISSPLHTFSTPGPHTVQLIVTNPCGREETIQQIVTAPGCLLPVEGLVFEGEYVDGNAELIWEVEEQIGVSHYILKRSANGVTFDNIANVSAEVGKHSYTWVDSLEFGWKLPAGTKNVFYRLRVVDLNGAGYNGETIELILSKPPFVLFPNPVGEDETCWLLFLQPEGGVTSFEILDLYGRPVWKRNDKLERGMQKILIPSKNAGSGSFFLKVIGPGVRKVLPLRVY